MDWPGAVLACAGLFLIVFGFSHAETAGWTAPLTIGSLVGGGCCWPGSLSPSSGLITDCCRCG